MCCDTVGAIATASDKGTNSQTLMRQYNTVNKTPIKQPDLLSGHLRLSMAASYQSPNENYC